MVISFRFLRALSVVTIAFLISFFAIIVNPTPANAGVVPNSSCLGIDPNLNSGICVQSNAGGSYTWLGNFRSTNGSIFYCIDFLYSDTANPVTPYSSMKGLKNKNGISVPDASLRTLGYLIGKYAPTSDAGTPTANAAIALLVREVMNDSGGFYAASGGGFLLPGGTVGNINNGSGWTTPPAVLAQAQAYWNVGTQRYVGATGKYAITITSPNPVTETVPFVATINVKGAANVGVPGLPITLTATNGTLSTSSGTTDASGNVVVNATPNVNVATMAITAKINAFTYATYFKPVGWPTNQIQRAIVGATAVAAGNATKTVTVINATTTIRALKINKDTSDPLPGATLQLKADGTSIGSWVTDANGYTPYVSANVGSTICIYELATPPGFIAPPSSEALVCHAVTVPDAPLTLTVQNTPTPLLIPTITTVTSSQQVTPNTPIYDTVTVANTGGATIPATWTLLGPVAPNQTASNACDSVNYASAPIAASGTFTVTGDGTQNVGNFTPTVLGCYGYNETLEATATTAAASSTTSDPNETLLVKDTMLTPVIDTTANDTGINVAGGNFDNVVVSNTGGATINATVTIFGPMPANKTSATPCASIDWTTAPIAHTDDWVVEGDNTYKVGQWEFLVEGCYTYVQTLPATWTTNAVTTSAGIEKETFVVTPVPLTPVVTTVVSSQQIVPKTPIYDTVSVTGTGGAEIAGTWKLYGPMTADKTSATPCAKIDWTKAPTAANGTFTVTGDGSYKTGEFTPTSLGCYTYTETLSRTWTTDSITTPVGVASETTLVKNERVTPTITTQASSNKLKPGEGFYDYVIISGFPAGESVTGTWETVGPVAPKEGDNPCENVDWTNAPVVASGSMTITGDDTYETGTYVPDAEGCYSFRETFPVGWATNEFSTSPGYVAAEIVQVVAGETPVPTPVPATPTPEATVVVTPDTPLADTGAGSILNIVAIGLLTLAFGGILLGASTMIKGK